MANIARLKIFVIVTLSCEVWCQMQAWQSNWQGFSAFFTVFLFLNILWRQKLHSLNIITRKPDDMFNKKLLIGEKRMKIAFCEHFCKTNIFPRILPILNFKFTIFTKFLKGTQRLSPFRVPQRSGKTKNKLKFQVGLN